MKSDNGSLFRVLDFVLLPVLLYLSLWIYELSNYVVMAASGYQGSLIVQGVIPAGFVAVGQGSSPFILAKPLQVLMATGSVLPLYIGLRRTRFQLSLLASASILAIYLSSFYWELLSLVGPLPLLFHETLFTVITVTALTIFTRADSRLKMLIW